MLSISNSLRLKLSELALESPQKEQHGAIITQGKKFICGACNTPRTQFRNFIPRYQCHHHHNKSDGICFGHAEVNVINKFLSLFGPKNKSCFLQVFPEKQKV